MKRIGFTLLATSGLATVSALLTGSFETAPLAYAFCGLIFAVASGFVLFRR